MLRGFEQPPFYCVLLSDREYSQVTAGQLCCSTGLSLGNQLVAGLFSRGWHIGWDAQAQLPLHIVSVSAYVVSPQG